MGPPGFGTGSAVQSCTINSRSPTALAATSVCPLSTRRASQVPPAPVIWYASPSATAIPLSPRRRHRFSGHPYVRLQTAVYSCLPTWRMLAFDETLYLSAFGASAEGHRSGMYKLTAAADGVLHAGFRRYFNDLWRGARQQNGGPVA
jgi:hypothetical protein